MKYLTLLYFIIFTLIISESFAQCDSGSDKVPCFTTIDTIGCIPYSIKVNDCSGVCVPRYIYENNVRTRDSTHTFTTAGIFDVIQQIGTSQIESSAPIRVRAVSDLKPIFEINYCKDRIITLTFDKKNLYDKYIINYGDGSPIDTVNANESPQKQYSNDSQKTVSVKGIYNYAPCTNTSTAVAFPQNELALPTINSVATDNLSDTTGSLKIQLNASSFFGYELYLATGNTTFQSIDSIHISNGDTTITIEGLNTVANSYCLYFSTYDYCGNTKISDTLCSISLTADAENNQNLVKWMHYPKASKITSYLLLKNTIELSFNKSDTSYIDTNVVCANNYCYTIKTQVNNNTSIISNSLCVKSISTDTPLSIKHFQSTTLGKDSIQLTWSSPLPYLVYETNIQHSTVNNNYNYLSSTSNFNTTYFHTTPTNSTNCYIINYTDACGNNSDINIPDTTCTVFLEAKKIQDTEYELSWTPYIGIDTINYIVEYLDEKGEVAFEKSIGMNLFYHDESPLQDFQNLRYRIKALSNHGETSLSNTVEFELKSRIFVPNAFSPDGDGINDYFKPDTRFIENYTLSIFDRWGELIFYEKNSDNGWNGHYKGKIVATGTYVYLLEGTDYYGNTINKKGTVTVYY